MSTELNQIQENDYGYISGIEQFKNYLNVFPSDDIVFRRRIKIDRIFKMKNFKECIYILSGFYYENCYSDYIEQVTGDNNLYIKIYKYDLVFDREFKLNMISNPVNIHVEDNYIIIIGDYIDRRIELTKCETKYLFIFNQIGILLRKTNLLIIERIHDFIISNNLIICVLCKNSKNEELYNLIKIKF